MYANIWRYIYRYMHILKHTYTLNNECALWKSENNFVQVLAYIKQNKKMGVWAFKNYLWCSLFMITKQPDGKQSGEKICFITVVNKHDENAQNIQSHETEQSKDFFFEWWLDEIKPPKLQLSLKTQYPLQHQLQAKEKELANVKLIINIYFLSHYSCSNCGLSSLLSMWQCISFEEGRIGKLLSLTCSFIHSFIFFLKEKKNP